jgi:DNA invertase Pin-like site-specific DNA recombinase
MVGIPAVFAGFERDILRDRVCDWIAQALKEGMCHGRPATAWPQADEAKSVFQQGLRKRSTAKRFGIGRTAVRRLVSGKKSGCESYCGAG